MIVPPKYILTSKISEYLQSLEASKEVINSVFVPKEVELNIRRQSSLKSSLFSARIEGNTMTLDDLPKAASRDQKRIEIYNILKGFSFIFERGSKKDLTSKDLLSLHQIVMNGLIDSMDLGRFRSESSAIFNSAGIAIYLPPRPAQLATLIERLIKFVNSPKETFIPIRACLAHYTFEKIHPFLDGNGRVGRLLLQLILEKSGYGMKGLLPVEQFLDKERADYYHALETTERDVTEYLEFMLEALATTAMEARTLILEKKEVERIDYLLPRRAEILNIIKDQKLVNFDMIRRRFLAINERTLRYDLKQLQNAGLIRKLGTTKGVYYEVA